LVAAGEWLPVPIGVDQRSSGPRFARQKHEPADDHSGSAAVEEMRMTSNHVVLWVTVLTGLLCGHALV
jgi:hypothetical protein